MLEPGMSTEGSALQPLALKPSKEISDKSSYEFNFKKSEILNALASSHHFFNADFIRSKSIDLGSGVSIRNKVSENILPIKAALKKALRGLAPGKKPLTKVTNIDTITLNRSSNRLDIRSLDLAHVEIYSHKNLNSVHSEPLSSTYSGDSQLRKNFKEQRTNEESMSTKASEGKSETDIRSREQSEYNHGKDSCNNGLYSRDTQSTYYRTPKIIFVKNKFSLQGCQTQYGDVASRVNYCCCETKDYTYHIIDDPSLLPQCSGHLGDTRTKYPAHPHPPLTRRTHSVSHCLDMTRLSPPSTEPGPPRRHRHSISGQMSYYRTGVGLMLHSHGHRRVGSASSLFSTAVISGSSSAPNLRDMIPNSASVAGQYPSSSTTLTNGSFKVCLFTPLNIRSPIHKLSVKNFPSIS